jgi:hypothetical protein
MKSQLQITFRGMPPNETLRDIVRQKFEATALRLAGHASCRVLLDRACVGYPAGPLVSVHLELRTAHGTRIYVHTMDEKPVIALREAFERIDGKAAHRAGAHGRPDAPRLFCEAESGAPPFALRH